MLVGQSGVLMARSTSISVFFFFWLFVVILFFLLFLKRVRTPFFHLNCYFCVIGRIILCFGDKNLHYLIKFIKKGKFWSCSSTDFHFEFIFKISNLKD